MVLVRVAHRDQVAEAGGFLARCRSPIPPQPMRAIFGRSLALLAPSRPAGPRARLRSINHMGSPVAAASREEVFKKERREIWMRLLAMVTLDKFKTCAIRQSFFGKRETISDRGQAVEPSPTSNRSRRDSMTPFTSP